VVLQILTGSGFGNNGRGTAEMMSSFDFFTLYCLSDLLTFFCLSPFNS
jgi:hypothetical protein